MGKFNLQGIVIIIPTIVVIISINYLIQQGLDVPSELTNSLSTLVAALVGLVIPLTKES